MGDFKVHHVRFFNYAPKSIHCLAFDENNEKLAVSRSDGSVEIWSVKDDWYQEKLIHGDEEHSVEAVIWWNSRLFSGGLSGDMIEYDLLACDIRNNEAGNSGAIWCLVLNDKNGEVAAGTEGGSVVIFTLDEDGAKYTRSLDKQEGRIISIAWFIEDDLIVTGGIDNIRIWSRRSGHAIQRLTVPRQEANKETIVWAVAVTADFTIISGDSRGKTCFWDGRHGTCLKSFQSHKADVLTLSVNKDGNSVFSSGIDPVLTQFEFIATRSDSDCKMWVRSSVRSQHTHDVRAIEVIGDAIVSGGVDCQLIFNHLEAKKGIKTWRRISPIPHTSIPLVSIAKSSNVIMFRYTDYLEVWKLGSTTRSSDKNGDILPLKDRPVKLVQLKSKGGETIISASISKCANRIAYSDQFNIRVFNATLTPAAGTPSVQLTRISTITEGVLPARCLEFTQCGNRLISATIEGNIQILEVLEAGLEPSSCDSRVVLKASLPPPSMPALGLHLLAVHPLGHCAAAGSHDGKVYVYSLADTPQLVCALPRYPCQPTALAFHPTSDVVIAAYSDQRLVEFDCAAREYTAWSRRLAANWHPQWLKRHAKLTQVWYHPRQPHLVFVHDEAMFCVINQTQHFPGASDKLTPGGRPGPAGAQAAPGPDVAHCMHLCSRYKFLLHLDVLDDDCLCVVEQPPLAIIQALPPALATKKFGT